MPTEIELIQEGLNRIRDLEEVASLYQRKMQVTDDKIVRQEKRQVQMNEMLKNIGE